MDKKLEVEIRGIVRDEITASALKFRRSTSSVEINRSTTGKPSFSVKVYNDDPVRAVNLNRYLERKLRSEYFDEEYVDAPAIESPTDEEMAAALGEGPPAPAAVAGAASGTGEEDFTDVGFNDIPGEKLPDADFD